MSDKTKFYRGIRGMGGCDVKWGTLHEYHTQLRNSLPARLDLRNHSSSGFGWGYGGSGPSQLALALCAHATGDDQRALRVYQEFKWKVVANLPYGGWEILQVNVLSDIEGIERAQAEAEEA